ncbi:hypothetical protein KFK09_014315 [Dendrobium nobile]|uniref:(+)-neomenthol dehydrogenase n=1 Tax=Dendrobium nobile TaxID=94219 RepID=A0A8T3BBQ7_DENNO|nr:hypothetical protein KFK09_014315 [Dendrobium nobile]
MYTCRWWTEKTVAIVTGANKGIGFAIVEKLAELGVMVVLTCRNEMKGIEAVLCLAKRGLTVEFCKLDVTSHESISKFACWLHGRFGGLDILVNNAGVSFNEIDSNNVEKAELVIRTNFYGQKMLIQELLPLFRRSVATKSRILNISSQLGLQNKVSNPALKNLQKEEEISEEKIDYMLNKFVEDVKKGTWKEAGWPKIWTDYSVSKQAVNAYSRFLSKQQKGQNLSINCFCPGFTKTAMTGGMGTHTAQEAAEVAVRVILLPPEELPTGKFFKWLSPSFFSML